MAVEIWYYKINNMPNLEKTYLYRITHIDNIPHIIQHGMTHSASPAANPNYRGIGDSTLIETRKKTRLSNGKTLGDYIPFYLGYRMPMLYVIHYNYNQVHDTKQKDIIYCVSSVQKIIDLGVPFIFTDGHAVSNSCYAGW